MLPKKHRLTKSAEVKKTTAKGRGFFNPYFVIKSLLGKETFAKITVVVSTKVSKKAVVRNRLKRIIRDELSNYIADFKPGTYTILVKSTALNISSEQLRQELQKSFKSSKVLIKSL